MTPSGPSFSVIAALILRRERGPGQAAAVSERHDVPRETRPARVLD